jgi:hypothetical protein
LTAVFSQPRKSGAGRKAYDVVLMFKILSFHRLANLSNEGTEFQINDRQSFERFLGMPLGRAVPDFSIVWLFREALDAGGGDQAADCRARGVLVRSGI